MPLGLWRPCRVPPRPYRHPVHILVRRRHRGGRGRIRLFEFGLVGVPVVIAVIAIVVFFGTRLLPERVAESIPPDLSDHARALSISNHWSTGWRGSRFRTIRRWSESRRHLSISTPSQPSALSESRECWRRPACGFSHRSGLGDHRPGRADVIHGFAEDNLLAACPERPAGSSSIARSAWSRWLFPLVRLIGEKMFPGMTTESGDFVVLPIQRAGENLHRGPASLAVGDTMLLQGTWHALDPRIESDRDVLVVDSPSLVRRQAVALGPRAWWAIAILVGMVILLATNAVPAVEAALLAAGAMILTRVVTIYQAYKSVSWTTVVLVAGMIPLSTAVTQSGAADDIAQLLIDVVGNAGPYALLLGLFVLTAIFGQLISNMATASS